VTDNNPQQILDAIYQVVQERKSSPAEKSYVASLYAKGLDKILGKIGHTLVLLGYYDLPPERIYSELARRFGLSGLVEKESRTKNE
jgi:phosphoribosyl-ATP pyrophosphohydrolase/phosphoribosyl-AMP cyclohydrolase